MRFVCYLGVLNLFFNLNMIWFDMAQPCVFVTKTYYVYKCVSCFCYNSIICFTPQSVLTYNNCEVESNVLSIQWYWPVQTCVCCKQNKYYVISSILVVPHIPKTSDWWPLLSKIVFLLSYLESHRFVLLLVTFVYYESPGWITANARFQITVLVQYGCGWSRFY